jgi:replicative DNA helicase
MAEHESAQLESLALGALLDAEGGILRARVGDLLAASTLTPEDFAGDGRRLVLQAIKALADKGRPADPASVYGLCKGSREAPELEPLVSLQASNASNRESFLSHAEELRRLSLLRRLESFHRAQLEELAKARPDPSRLGQALETFGQGFAATTEPDETGDVDAIELIEAWDAAMAGKRLPCVPSGIRILDEAIDGFVPNLNVIGGLASVGKSALIGEVILSCLERGLRVGLFGLEDATSWLTRRHVARGLGIPVSAVGSARLHETQQERLQEVAGNLANLTRNLLVYRRAGIEPAELVARCKRWILNKGVQVLFVDHGGEVQHDTGGRRERFDLAVASTYRALRDLAINHGVPVVVLAHFNREVEKDLGGVPNMQSFAETEYIARMARLALGLWQKPGDERLRCTVLKRTEGERGITVAIERDERFALVKRHGGERLDLRDEAEMERHAAEEAKRARRAPVWKKQAES